MDTMEKQKDERAGIAKEREQKGAPQPQSLILQIMFFTIYSLVIMLEDNQRSMSAPIIILLFVLLAGCWIVELKKVGMLPQRTAMISTIIQIGIFIFGITFCNIQEIIPMFIVMLILVSFCGNHKLSFSFVVSLNGLFLYYVLTGKPMGFEKDGLGMTIFQIVNANLAVFLVVFWNKQRSINMKRLVGMIQEAKAAERIKDDFLANISHEIRTPLNTINGLSDTIEKDEKLEELKEKVALIHKAGKELSDIVSNILDFSELQKGVKEVESEEYSTFSMIDEVIKSTQAKLKDKELEFIVNCDADLPSKLCGDEKKIRRVLMNLIDNAIKFTEIGYVSICISCRKEEYGINLIVEIKDSGIGMDESNIRKVFAGFSQLDSHRNRKQDGAGLGLPISQILVNNMGGVLNVSSKKNIGTDVKVVIPQKMVDASPIAKVENHENVHVGVYVNMEHFVVSEIRDEYGRNIKKMIECLNVKTKLCHSQTELESMVKTEKFTHIFISILEYKASKDYFNELAKQLFLVVVLDKKDETILENEDVIRLYKPMYIVPIAKILSGEIKRKQSNEDILVTSKFNTTATILAVDDNKINLKVIETLLKKYDANVLTAESGRKAIEIVKTNTVDLVFMDHMMPEMDGVEAMKRIRAIGGGGYQFLPIVILTANAVAGNREKFLESGFNDFVEKPVEKSVFERALLRNLPANKVQYEEQAETPIAVEPESEEKEKPEEIPNTAEKSIEEVAQEVTTPESMQEQLVIGDLDLTTGYTYCGGKEGFLSILQVFVDNYEDNYRQICDLYAQENWDEYTICVHGVKSSMKSIGALKLSDMAKELEMAGKRADIEYIHNHHQAFDTEYQRVMGFIMEHPLFKSKDESKKEEADESQKQLRNLTEDEFNQYINQFEEATYEFDEDKMNEVVLKLKEYSYLGQSLEKVLEAVSRKILANDYMSAENTLRNTKKSIENKQSSDTPYQEQQD